MEELRDLMSPGAAVRTTESTSSSSRRPQYVAAIAVTFGAMTAGTILAWTSPALPYLQGTNSTISLSESEASWVGSLVAIGALTGAFPAGFCADRFGRKLTIISLSAPFILSWALIAFSRSLVVLYLARFMAGVATGAISVTAPMYIGEVAETAVRGALGSFFQLMLTVGILFAYVFGAIVSYTMLAILSAAIPILFLVSFAFVPETPTYLLKKNRKQDARKSLQWLRGGGYDVEPELLKLQAELEEDSRSKATIKDLVSSRGTVKALIICLGLMVFQQLSGVNAVIFYTSKIFAAAGSTLDSNVAAIIVGVVQVMVTYAATLLVDRAGRRMLLLISSSVMMICLCILALYFMLKQAGTDVSDIGWLPLISVAVFIVVFSLGFGPIPWMMMGELFPSNIKGIASGVAVTLNWILVFIVTKTFQNLIDGFGSDFTFFLFAFVCCCGTGFVYFFVPETKGKSLQEIQHLLNGTVVSDNSAAAAVKI